MINYPFIIENYRDFYELHWTRFPIVKPFLGYNGDIDEPFEFCDFKNTCKVNVTNEERWKIVKDGYIIPNQWRDAVGKDPPGKHV